MAATAANSSSSKKSGAAASKSSKTAARGHKSGKGSKAALRRAQMSPTPQRYQEIQQALAAKGYFAGEANGRWGADSVEALRHFQRDQNLTDTGKLNSVSLIALGLGPKRSLTAQTHPQPTETRP